MRIIVFAVLSFFIIGLDSQAMQPACMSTRTPCPYFNMLVNHMIKTGKIAVDTQKLAAQELVNYSYSWFGIDKSLMERLANGRADSNGDVDIAGLLNPFQFPAHKGSLARVDAQTPDEFAEVDSKRLDILNNDQNYSTTLTVHGNSNKYISYKQLKKYQVEYCWARSDMSNWKDWVPAKAEVHLLWALFGAYKIKDSSGIEYIPFELVYNFLRDAVLPENFHANTDNPATLCSVTCAILTE
jgi:hypothetical protein